MKKIITIFCTFFAFYATAQEVSIIPQPSKITFPEKGEFVLSSSTVIVANKKE